MNRRIFPRCLFFIVLIFGLCTLPLAAEGFFSKISWFLEGSILFIPESNGLESDPMPVLISPGIGTFYPIKTFSKSSIGLGLTLDIYWTHYGYHYGLDRPIPNAIENRTAQVIGFPLALQVTWAFDITSLVTLRVFGGPAADLRIVLIASDLNEGLDPMDEISSQTDSVRSYFWSRGRWFLPVLGTGADFAITPRFKLGIDVRVWIPTYRFWTNENLPLIEGWRFAPGIRLTIR